MGKIHRLDMMDILIFLKKEKYCIKRKFTVVAFSENEICI